MIPEREAWEEEAAAKSYQEALRRIRIAKETGAVHLDLTGLKDDGRYTALYFLDRLPPELAELDSLLSLDLQLRSAQQFIFPGRPRFTQNSRSHWVRKLATSLRWPA
jgi:hypothetical protein